MSSNFNVFNVGAKGKFLRSLLFRIVNDSWLESIASSIGGSAYFNSFSERLHLLYILNEVSDSMKTTFFTALFLCFFAGSSFAEWRLELYGGVFFPGRSDLTVKRPLAGDNVTYRDLAWDDRSFEKPIYYGYRIGYFFGDQDRTGIELELVHAKIYSDPDSHLMASGLIANQPVDGLRRLGEHIQRFDLSHGHNLLMVNFVRKAAPWREGTFSSTRPHLVFRAGIGPSISHTESLIEDRFKDGYEIGGLGVQAAAGVVMPLANNFYLPFEYKYSYSWLRDLDIVQGKADMNVGGSHLAFGAGVRF